MRTLRSILPLGGLATSSLGALAALTLTAAPVTAQCDPVQAGAISGSYGDLLVSANVAYATGVNSYPGLWVLDISDPTNPVTIASWYVSNAWYDVESVALSGTTLYANGLYLLAFDVSDPANPTLLSQTATPVCCAQTNTLVVEGNTAYQAGGQFVAWDITDPTAPVTLSVTSVNAVIQSLAIEGTHAFILSPNGLQVINISNPSSPTVLSTTPTGGTGLTVEGNYAYVATGVGGGLAVFDVSDPSSPFLVSSVPVAEPGLTGGLYEVVLSGTKAFGKLVNSSGIAVFDVSDPTSPILENIANLGGGGSNGDIEVQDGFAYTSHNGQITVFDASSCLATPDTPPVASAGADFSVDEGQGFVMLDGSGSNDPDGDPLDYAWAQTSGTAVALSDPNVAQPTFTAPLVGIGGETLSFELAVTANGEMAADSVNVTVNNLNQTPVVTITDPTDGIVSGSTSITVSADVTDEDSTTITSTPAGLAPGTLAAGGGTVSGSLSLDLEGPNDIIVSVTDAGGLTAATSIVVYRDTAAPSVVISPAEGTVVSTPIPSFGITVTDQTLTDVSIDGIPAGSAVVPGGDIYGVATALLTGSIPLWSEGANVIVVEATDAGGNTAIVTRTVILDSTAPVVTIDTPTNGACYGVGSDPEIPLSATINDATATEVTGALTGSLPAGGGSLMGTFTLVEGVNQISVSAQDNAGTGLNATDTVSVTLDTIAPMVEITVPDDLACVRGTIEFHATASDVLPGAVATSTFFVDGVALAQTEIYTVDTTTLSDGPHELSVVAADSCGNTASAAITIEVDNTAPGVTLSNPFDLDWVSGTIDFDASASDGGTGLAAITMMAGGAAPSTDGSQVYTTPVGSGFATSMVDTVAALGGLDGELELEVTAIDCAGNETTVAITVQVDNTAPGKAITSPADGSVVRCNLRIVADASDPNLASVQFVVDGVAGAVLNTAPFETSYDTRDRLDGDLPITLIAIDLAGNVSTCTINVTIDNLDVRIRPRRLRLRSRGCNRSVTAGIEGQSADLLTDLDPADITMCVPGGSPIPATSIYGYQGGWRCNDELSWWHRGHRRWHRRGCHGSESRVKVKFDRRLLIGSLRGAGVQNGRVELEIKATVDGETFVIGTDTIKVRN